MIRQNIVWIVVCSIVSLLCYKVVNRNSQGHYCAQIFNHIQNSYLDEKTPEELRVLFENATDSMLRKLDENNDYIPAEDATDYRNSLNSTVDGIGVLPFADSKNENLFVLSVVPNSPAEKIGVKPSDKIIEVNNNSVKKLGANEIIKLIRGEPGTTVNLRIQRFDSPDLISFDIIREQINTHSVFGYRRDEKRAWKYQIDEDPRITYIRIDQFSQESDNEVKEIFDSIPNQTPGGLVLDMRGNGGGQLPTATRIADLFLKSGKIVSVRSPRLPDLEEDFIAEEKGTLPDFPMAVLIDRNTASASELLAAALQDNHRATIIGERSFGKGTVQHLIRLTPMFEKNRPVSPILKLTVAKYVRPNGKDIHRPLRRVSDNKTPDENASWGVAPDERFAKKLTDDERTRRWHFQSKLESGQQITREEILAKWKLNEPKEEGLGERAMESGKLMDDNSPDPHLKQAIEFLQKKIDAK